MIKKFKEMFGGWILSFFVSKKNIKLGIYGPPNSGKTTLANKICQDWLGESMGSVSPIAHETREIHIKEQISIKSESGRVSLSRKFRHDPMLTT